MAAIDRLNPNDRVRPKAVRLQRRLGHMVDRYAGSSAYSGDAVCPTMLPPHTFDEILDGEWHFELAYLLRDGEPRLRAIFVWLLGHQTSRFNLRGIDNYIRDPDPVVRRQVAKALRRLEATAKLQEMVDLWPDDQWVEQYGFEPRRAPYQERLARFVTHNVHGTHADAAVGPSRMPLWARDPFWFLSPPKSAAAIRHLLQRIRRWASQRPS